MIFMERDKEKSNLLSASRGLSTRRSETKVVHHKPLKPVLSQKQILIVYVSENERFYIKRSSAFALGLTDTRAMMVDGTNDLLEISKRQLAILSSRENLEVKLEKVAVNEQLPERPKIKVYKDNLNHFIEMSAAYALGLVSIDTFNVMSEELYPVAENLLIFLNNKYDVELVELGENFGSRPGRV